MTKDIEREIQEAFHENAHNQGFCLDQKWSDCDNPYLDHDTHLAYEFYKDGWKAAKAHEAEKLKGIVVAPFEPTEDQWGGLARVLGRYMQNKDRYCPNSLKRHLDMFADSIPEWLNKEVPNWESEHAFATADLPVFIYKAMLEAVRGGK